MVHIQDLPIEILNHILSFIFYPKYESFEKLPEGEDEGEKPKGVTAEELKRGDRHDDENDDVNVTLLNLCLVSRLFRDLAQPVLFHDFEEDGWTEDISKTISFTRSIYRRPDLGQHVMSIDITVPFTLGAHSDLGVEDSVLFKGEIKNLRFTEPLKKTWIAAMEKSDLSVFLALLIIKTPKLRWLFLPGGQISTIPFAQLFNRYPSFLSNLEHLWINSDPDLVGFDIASYQNFVTCPNLSTLTFTYGDLDLPSFPSTWKPGKLTAEEVSFYQCHIDGGAIQKFMKACKKLTHFTYESFSLDLEDQQLRPLKVGRELNAENARQGALLHKDTLRLFYLGFARDPWIIEDIEGYQGYLSSRTKIGSLRDFSVLETIYIPHADLPPHPQFPRSLKTLHITDCNSSILGMIRNIAADCKNGLYPNFINFKVLALDITRPIKLPGQRIPPGKTPEECFLGLRDMFKDTTVDFQIVPYNMPDNDDYGIDDEDLEDEGFSGEIPPALEELIMRAALQDPNFPHGFVRGGPNAANDDSWETEDDD